MKPFIRRGDKDYSEPYINWNTALNNNVVRFSVSHPDATIMTFSAYDIFSRVLSDPAAYGFDELEAHKEGGPIWFDRIHPTSAMHRIISQEVAEFLASQAAFKVFPSLTVQIGSHWPGLAGFKHLIVL